IEDDRPVGPDPHEPFCRSEPDVRITILQDAQDVERAERGRHALGRGPVSVPPPEAPLGPDPETAISRRAERVDCLARQIVGTARETADEHGEQTAALRPQPHAAVWRLDHRPYPFLCGQWRQGLEMRARMSGDAMSTGGEQHGSVAPAR